MRGDITMEALYCVNDFEFSLRHFAIFIDVCMIWDLRGKERVYQ